MRLNEAPVCRSGGLNLSIKTAALVQRGAFGPGRENFDSREPPPKSARGGWCGAGRFATRDRKRGWAYAHRHHYHCCYYQSALVL